LMPMNPWLGKSTNLYPKIVLKGCLLRLFSWFVVAVTCKIWSSRAGLSENGAERQVICCTAERCNKQLLQLHRGLVTPLCGVMYGTRVIFIFCCARSAGNDDLSENQRTENRGQKGEQLRPVAIETAAYPLPDVLFMPGGGLLNIRDMLRRLHGRYLTAGDGI
jgi:hypothetical protein